MTIKKNLENERDTTWRTKGGSHKCAVPVPEVCPACGGTGYDEHIQECEKCQGTGEVWE